jgi:ABC-type lipoprotein export system ATPase subunit
MQYPIISVENVRKSFQLSGDKSVDVLKGVSMVINPGEFVVLYGPSGSGKSTLLNLIAGFENPTSGRVMARHRDLSHLKEEGIARYHRLKMGMVFQQFNLIKSLRVWENVALPAAASGAAEDKRHLRALHLLAQLHLGDYGDRHISELSGGEQQRVAIARALINDPYLMIFDEPTGNLDTATAKEIMNIVYHLNRKSGHTILMVTHNPDQLQYATRVIHVRDGIVEREEVMPEFILDEAVLPDAHYEAMKAVAPPQEQA